MTITRLNAERFAVVTTTALSDGTLRADYAMRLEGTCLRSVEERGCIRVGGLMRVQLGPVTLPRVQALAIGESLTVDGR